MKVRTQPDPPTRSELVEGIAFYPIALVVCATVLPGLTLCIPGLILGALFVVVPLAVLAVVIVAGAAIVATPVLLVRAVRRLARWRSASEPRVRVGGSAHAGTAPAVYFGRPTLASVATAHMAVTGMPPDRPAWLDRRAAPGAAIPLIDKDLRGTRGDDPATAGVRRPGGDQGIDWGLALTSAASRRRKLGA